jgi:tetratricopeptide (TPR) repeat protein
LGTESRACIASLLLLATPLIALPAVAQVSNQEQTMTWKVGDVVTEKTPTGWSTAKIIAVDTWPDGTEVAHCMTYETTSERPELGDVSSLAVRIMHAPIAMIGLGADLQLLGNLPVVKADLEGFLVYLKLTDFPRYLSVSGQDAQEVVREANRHYKQGIAFADAGDHERAIAAYGEAIDLFPLFFEAIDNQAFSYMDLGQYETAASIFEDSLEINPDGMAAFFSRGECLLRLGRLDEAAAIFREGQDRFPEERALFAEFAAKTQAARRN